MSYGLTEEQNSLMNVLEEFERGFKEEGISEACLKPLAPSTALAAWAHYPIMIEVEFEPEYENLRKTLIEYKKRSKLVQEVGNLMHEYQLHFHHLLSQRRQVMDLIETLNRDTSELVVKQKNYINLSMAVKESLDYYSYLDKFEFGWSCEISSRDMFEDRLQPTLSEFTDAIEFFSCNTQYSSAKKYLSGLLAARTKITSFTKSFFIKLLNKEYSFAIKNAKGSLWKHIDGYYPKSKPRFLLDFISLFPQLRRSLRLVLLACKEAAPEADVAHLEAREYEIDEFEFNESTLSLIGYLQTSIPELYEEVMLKFVAYYRTTLHESLYKAMEVDRNAELSEYFRDIFTKIVYILASEAAYLSYCLRPNSEIAREYIRTILGTISEMYGGSLSRLVKSKNKDPFGLCNEITFCLEETQKFFRNYLSRQYETYVIGAVVHYLDEPGVQLIKGIMEKMGAKIKQEVEPLCQNFLPKFKPATDQVTLTEQVREFIEVIPNLRFCPGKAEQYLVTSLDTLIKSVKEVNSRIDSRLECYTWDIEIFAAIEEALEYLPYHLIKKEVRLDMNETTSILEKVKRVNRDDNWLKYASDLLTVIKTGVPTLNELTLDFNKFIREHHQELRQKFVRDMVFVHAKNIIEFLQKLLAAPPEEAAKLCELHMLQKLHSGYLLSMENFMAQARSILKTRRKFSLHSDGEEQLKRLIEEVNEGLLDLMSSFYIETSKHCPDTEEFEPISLIRSKLERYWAQADSN